MAVPFRLVSLSFARAQHASWPIRNAAAAPQWLCGLVAAVAWADRKGTGGSAGYDVSGWGLTGGVEHGLGDFGRVGVSVAYLIGNNDASTMLTAMTSQEYKGGLYWRGHGAGCTPLRPA